MYLVLLRITGDKSLFSQHLAGHNAWLESGFQDGVFLVSGSLQGQPGGGILVHGLDEAGVQARVTADPFVSHGLVTPEILGISVSKTEPRLSFLLEAEA